MSEEREDNVESSKKSNANKSTATQKAKKAQQKAKKAKQTLDKLKNIKSLAPLISALSTIGIILLIIFLVIGFIGFFTTLPGLAIDKILEACENFWRWAVGDESIEIKDEDVDNLANYIQDMGYDLVGYGFISPGKVSEDESTGELKVDWEKSELQNLYGYLLANERTYTTQGLSYGLLSTWFSSYSITGNLISRLNQSVRNNWNISDPEKYGMLDFSEDVIEAEDIVKWDWSAAINVGMSKSVANAYDVKIDRTKNEMQITTKTGIFGINRDQVNWSLEGWTSRYGKPIELSLALHLSTMAPDFVYNFCTNSDLQTRVILKTKPVKYNYTYKYQHTSNGVAIGQPANSEDVIEKFEEMNRNQIERMDRLFSDGPHLEIDTRDNRNSREYFAVYPTYSLLEEWSKDGKNIATSIISVVTNDNTNNREFYTAVDKNGDPVSFSVLPQSCFTISFKSDGQPIINPNIAKGTENSFDVGDLTRGCKLDNGKTVKLELLSVQDLVFFVTSYYKYYGYSEEKIMNSLTAGGTSDYDGNDIVPCIILQRYQMFFDGFDNIINPGGVDGLFTEKHKEKAQKLDLNMEFNYYYKENQTIQGKIYVRDDEGNYVRENGNYKTETVERSIPLIKVSTKINLDTPIEGDSFVDSAGNKIKHNAGDMWNIIYKYFLNNKNAQLMDLRYMLWGIDLDDDGERDYRGFLELIQDEIHTIKFTESKSADEIDINDENYLKMLVVFSDDIDEYLSECAIEPDTFIKLYRVFKGLKTETLAWRPYIDRVVHHWYKDLNFSYDFNEVTGEQPSTTKEFNPEGEAEDSRITELEKDGKLYYTETLAEGSIDINQKGQPEIVKTESWHYMVKNWFLYGYYFTYDTTQETAEKIEKARKILSKEGLMADGYSESEAEKLAYDKNNPLLINVSSQESLYKNGSQEIDKKAKTLNNILKKHDDEVGGIRLKKIDFEKKESLDAFSILEGMHTKDSEYVYRDLKEFLIELGYFTRADFEEIETDVFQWIIPDYQVYKDEWPDPKFEKKDTEYGTYVRSESSLKEQREDIAKEDKEKRTTTTTSSSGHYTTSGDGYNHVTEVNGINYKDYKQFTGSYAGNAYFGGTMSDSGCGPTSAAIMLSGYGMDTSPWDVAKIIKEKYGNTTSSTTLVSALKDLNFTATRYDINGKNDQTAITNIEKALEEGKPVMMAGLFTSAGHWICLVGIKDGKAIIEDPGNVSNLNGKSGNITVKDLINNWAYGGSYIIPEKVPTGAIIKQEIQGFGKNLEIIAPEKGKIVEDETSEEQTQSTNTASNHQNQDEEKDYFKTNGNYVIIEFTEDNGVKGWKMKIEGMKNRTVSKGDTVKQGDKIGETDSDNIKIILYDDKDAIINDVEDYFKLKTRKTVSRVSQSYEMTEDEVLMLAKLIEIENGPSYTSMLLDGDMETAMTIAKATGYVCINNAKREGKRIKTGSDGIIYYPKYANPSLIESCTPSAESIEAAEWCARYDCSSITNPDGEPMTDNVTGQAGFPQCPGDSLNNLHCWWVVDWKRRGTYGVIEDYDTIGDDCDLFFCYCN